MFDDYKTEALLIDKLPEAFEENSNIVCSETSLDFDDYLLRLLSAEGDTQPGMWELIAVSKLLRMTILIFVEEPGGKWLFP